MNEASVIETLILMVDRLERLCRLSQMQQELLAENNLRAISPLLREREHSLQDLVALQGGVDINWQATEPVTSADVDSERVTLQKRVRALAEQFVALDGHFVAQLQAHQQAVAQRRFKRNARDHAATTLYRQVEHATGLVARAFGTEGRFLDERK